MTVTVTLLFLSTWGSNGVFAGSQKFTWRIATKMPPESTEGQAFSLFARRAEELSNGRLKMLVFPSEQLGDIQTSLEMLRAGTIQMYLEAAANFHIYVPGFDVLHLPYLITSREKLVEFFASPLVEEWREELRKKYGVRFLGELGKFVRGPWRCLIATKPVLSLQDVQGLKLRMFRSEAYQAAWEYLGADTIILPWTEIYEALKRGMIEGATSPIGLVRGMKFYEAAKYLMRTNEYSQSLTFAMNDKNWEELPPDLQKALVQAYNEACEFTQKVMYKEAEVAIKDMVENEGVTFIWLPNTTLNEFKEKLMPLYEKWAKEKKYGLTEEILKVLR